MRAISLWQPWASLWVTNIKGPETRHWSTSYRGQLLVHAAQKLCRDIDAELERIVVVQFGEDWAKALPRGAIVGMLELADCVPTELYPASAIERACGNYTPGRWAWVPQNIRQFCEPIPYKGHQGFFDVPIETVMPALAGGAIPTSPQTQGRLL